MNWFSSHTNRYSFEMVDPSDINLSRGTLHGFLEGSLTYGYYTDTRWSGNLKFYEPNYIENSLIRIYHHVDEWDYHNELGTFFVDDISSQYGENYGIKNFSLSSMISRVSNQLFTSNYTIGKGKYSKDVLKELFDFGNVQFEIDSEVSNRAYKSSIVYEVCSSLLSAIFDVCDNSSGRLSLNGRGLVLVNRYISPFSKEPEFHLRDAGIIGEISETDPKYNSANRVIVSYSDGKKTISGYRQLSSLYPNAQINSGRYIDSQYTVTDLNPPTKQGARDLAAYYLEYGLDFYKEWSFNSVYIPMSDGCVFSVDIDDIDRKVLLKTRTINLNPLMECNLYVKELL